MRLLPAAPDHPRRHLTGEWIHDQEVPGKGKIMKYGLYTCRGQTQCGTAEYNAPGSLGHEKQDAQWMVDAGMDYLKEDSCRGCTHQDPMQLYMTMEAALNATGKPVLFDMCWGSTQNMSQRVITGNSWRIGPDDGNWVNIVRNIDIDSGLAEFAGP